MLYITTAILYMVEMLMCFCMTFYNSVVPLITFMFLLGPMIGFTIACCLKSNVGHIDVDDYTEVSNYINLNKIGRGKY